MILDVAKACDDFGAHLSKLRSERNLSARALSKAISKSPEYIGGWERYPRPINRQILHEVCDVLGLPEHDRRYLFDLADKRIGLDQKRERHEGYYRMVFDVMAALRRARHELHHFDAVPDEAKHALMDCAAWILARLALEDSSEKWSPARMAWPAAFYTSERARRAAQKRKDLIAIPDDLIAQFVPESDSSTAPSADVSAQLANAAAEIFRRCVLSDPQRCADLAEQLDHWGIYVLNAADATVRFNFKGTWDLPIYHIRPATVASVVKRELANSIWRFGIEGPNDPRPAPVQTLEIDGEAYSSFFRARAIVTANHGEYPEPITDTLRQDFIDAYFVLSTPAWQSDEILVQLIKELADAVPDQVVNQVRCLIGGLFPRSHPTSQDVLAWMRYTLETAIRTIKQAKREESDRAYAEREFKPSASDIAWMNSFGFSPDSIWHRLLDALGKERLAGFLKSVAQEASAKISQGLASPESANTDVDVKEGPAAIKKTKHRRGKKR